MSLSHNHGDPSFLITPDEPAHCDACGRPVDPETCRLSSKGDDVYLCDECVADDAGEPDDDPLARPLFRVNFSDSLTRKIQEAK